MNTNKEKRKHSLAQEFEFVFIVFGIILMVLSGFILDKQKYEAVLFSGLGGLFIGMAITSYSFRIHIRRFYVNKLDLTNEIAKLIFKHGTTDLKVIVAMEVENDKP